MFFLAAALWMQTQTGQQADSSAADSSGFDPAIVQQVRVSMTVPHKTVKIGEHFTVTMRVHLPVALAKSLTFPSGPNADSTQDSVTNASPMQRHDSVAGGFVTATGTYVLSAWYPGTLSVLFGDAIVNQTHIVVPYDSIVVRRITPPSAFTDKNIKPKDPRALIPQPVILHALRHPQEHKRVLIPFILLLLALISWFFWWRYSHRDKRVMEKAVEWAEREFHRIEAMHLLERGEPEKHAILMSSVARQYLIRTFGTVRESTTTRELAEALRSEPLIPAERVLALFEKIDLLKFAHAEIRAAEAQQAGTESHTIVGEINDRHQAAVVALEAQQAADAAEKQSTTGSKQAA